jgi:hypothetical protein
MSASEALPENKQHVESTMCCRLGGNGTEREGRAIGQLLSCGLV